MVAVVVRDSLAFLRAYGRTALNAGEGLTHDALFRAEPLSELVNALAAARLSHDDARGLDAPVTPHIGELPPELRDVTLGQLLTHTAGMSHQLAVSGRVGANDPGRGGTRAHALRPNSRRAVRCLPMRAMPPAWWPRSSATA